MIPREQLAAFLDDALDPIQSTALDRELQKDAEALRFILEQRRMERLLASALAPDVRRQRLRHSVLAAIAGTSMESLQAKVLAEIQEARPATPARESAPDPTAGALGASRAWLYAIRERFAGPWSRTRTLGFPWKGWAWIAVAVVMLLVTIGVWRAGPGRPARLEAEIGTWAEVVGVPTHQRQGNRTVAAAQRGTTVRWGDCLETGDADRAEIRFIDGTTLRLGFNTRVDIGKRKAESRYSESRNAEGRHARVPLVRPEEIHLIQGQVWTVVAKTTNASTYAIRTDAATAIARGTEFGVKLQRTDGAAGTPPFATILTVKEGLVDFTNAHGSVQATAMTESTATADSAPTEPRRLESLQVVPLARGGEWMLMSRPLDGPTAVQKRVGGGGWVGLVLRDVPSVDPAGGTEVRVSRVWPGSAAAQAGLQAGDVILAVSGRKVDRAGVLEGTVLMRTGEPMRWEWRRRDSDEIQSAALTPTLMPAHPLAPTLAAELQAAVNALGRRWTEEGWVRPIPIELERRLRLDIETLPSSAAVRAAAFHQLGLLSELQDELGPAIRAYGTAVGLAPAEAMYRFHLGLALRAMGSFERAREELAVAAELAPGELAIRKHLVGLESLLGAEERALAGSEGLVAAAPGDHGVWELRAQLLFKAGRLAEAAEAARRTIALDDACPVGWSYLAQALVGLEQWDEARTTWQAALTRAPFEPAFHLNLGHLDQDLGRWGPAEVRLRRAAELRPDWPLAWWSLGRLLMDAPPAMAPEVRTDTSNVDASRSPGQRDLRGAEEALRRAVALDPDDPEIPFSLGLLFHRSGRLEEAEDWLRRALALNPESAVLHNNLGDVLRLRGELDEAELSFRRALDLDPELASPRPNLAILLSLRGRHAEAEAVFRDLVDQEVDAPPARRVPNLVNLALAVSQQGRIDEAEGWFRQALPLALLLPAQTWQTVDSFQYVEGSRSLVGDIGTDASGRVYAVGSGALDPNDTQRVGVVALSTDAGDTWTTLAALTDPVLPVTHHRAFAADAYGRLFVGGNALMVFDLAHPAQPRLLGVWMSDLQSYGLRLAVSGAHAFVVGTRRAPPGTWPLEWEVRVVDWSDPTEPREEGRLPLDPGWGGVKAAAADGDHLCLAVGDVGLRVVDVRNPAQPRWAGVHQSLWERGDAVAVSGNRAFFASSLHDVSVPSYWRSRVEVIDLAHPDGPTPLGFSPETFAPIDSLAVVGSRVFVARGVISFGGWGVPGEGSFDILDASDPTAPVWAGNVPLVSGLPEYPTMSSPRVADATTPQPIYRPPRSGCGRHRT